MSASDRLWGGPLAPAPPSTHYYALRRAAGKHLEPLTALVVFQRDAGTIPVLVSDPSVGRAKAHWWRSEIARMKEGGGDHPVAAALAPALQTGRLKADDLRPVLDAVDDDLDGGSFRDAADLLTYGVQLGGTTYRAAVRLLLDEPATAEAWAEALGAAVALTGRLRGFAQHARHGRLYLPATLLESHGLSVEGALAAATGGHGSEPAALHAALHDYAGVLDAFYDEAERHTPDRRTRRALRPVIAHAAAYRQLLAQMAERGVGTVVSARVQLTALRKLWVTQWAR